MKKIQTRKSRKWKWIKMNETVELVNKLILIITPIVMTIFISWASWCIISHATAMMSAKTIEAKKRAKKRYYF